MTDRYRKFVRYQDLVDTMPEAFTFVMEHLDEFKTPDIEISAITGIWEDNPDAMEAVATTKFQVAIAGDIESGDNG